MPADAPEPDLDGFTAEQIAFAIAAWPLRCAEELRSARIYRALAHSSRAVLARAWSSRFWAVAHEEVGHARLCRSVGERLGAAEPAHDAGPVRDRLATLPDPAERTLALVLTEVAMGETISMVLFRAGHRAATEPLTRWALGGIERDETRHQKLGWDALDALEARPEAMEREATRSLGAMEQQIAVPALRWLEAGRPFDPACARLGALAPEARVEAFYDAVERLVLPRLEKRGVDAARAWQRRYAS